MPFDGQELGREHVWTKVNGILLNFGTAHLRLNKHAFEQMQSRTL